MRKKHILSFLLSIGLISIVFFVHVQNQEQVISYEYYNSYSYQPIIDGEKYNLDKTYSSIIDYEDLRLACNKYEDLRLACNKDEDRTYLQKLNFSEEAYLVSLGKPIKRLYWKKSENIELLNREIGHILFIEYEDIKLSQKAYVYIFDNTNGPYCTEDEKIQFID